MPEQTSLKDHFYAYNLRNLQPNEYAKYSTTQAQKIAFTILDDITDRRGWRQEWDGFDNDVQEEIIQTWIDKITTLLDEK